MSDAVQQIKDRLSIVDVVSQYMELHPAGKNMKGKSPFTAEKTPSFYVSPDRGMYYCFSSSQGGDIFSFVQAMEGVDFKGALKQLAERAGVELVPEDPKKKGERDRQYDALEAATVFYTNWLGKHTEAFTYLESRKVTPQTIAKWRIGYAPGPPQFGWRDTKLALEAKNFTKDELQKTGLIKGGVDGKEAYDVFRDRVMFPIFDPSGRVVGFSGRILAKDTEAPKYVNSPDTDLFNKSEILFGYDKAKQGIRSFDFSLIVEGQFDVIMSHQAGYHNAVAVSGTALTDHQVGLLQRLSNKVVLALDADRAGIAAVKRGAAIMLARGMDVKVAQMPDGADPADLVAAGDGSFKKVIKEAKHVIEFLLDTLQVATADERSFKLKAREEVLPFVVRIPNRIDQEHFEHLIAERLKTTKDAVHMEVERLRQTMSKDRIELKPPASNQIAEVPTANNQGRLQIQKGDISDHILLVVDVLEPALASNVKLCYEEITARDFATERRLIDPTRESKIIFTLEEQYTKLPVTQLRADLAHLLTIFAQMHQKALLKDAHAVLRQAEEVGEDTTTAMQTIANIQKRLGEIHVTAEQLEVRKSLDK